MASCCSLALTRRPRTNEKRISKSSIRGLMPPGMGRCAPPSVLCVVMVFLPLVFHAVAGVYIFMSKICITYVITAINIFPPAKMNKVLSY